MTATRVPTWRTSAAVLWRIAPGSTSARLRGWNPAVLPNPSYQSERRLLGRLTERVVDDEPLHRLAVDPGRGREHLRREIVRVDDRDVDLVAGARRDPGGDAPNFVVDVGRRLARPRVVRRQVRARRTVDGVHPPAGDAIEDTAL